MGKRRRVGPPSEPAKARPLLRDQERACLAYAKVEEVGVDQQGDYRILVRALTMDLRRMGLAAALSQLERSKKPASALLLKHLAEANIDGLGRNAETFARRARALDDLGQYMLATRELLRLTAWFTRAVQATFAETDHAT